MVKALNHIGIAVRAIEAHRTYYEGVLGARFEGIETVNDQNVRVAFYRIGDEESSVRIELLEPVSEESPIHRFLERRGEGLHHIAFTVENLAARLEELRNHGLTLIDGQPRPGAHGMSIAFLHPSSTGRVLTELCEPAARSTPPQLEVS